MAGNRYTCEYPTTIGARTPYQILKEKGALSTEAMQTEIKETLNPDLGRCGEMAECGECGLRNAKPTTPGEEMIVVVRRVRSAIRAADMF